MHPQAFRGTSGAPDPLSIWRASRYASLTNAALEGADMVTRRLLTGIDCLRAVLVIQWALGAGTAFGAQVEIN
jgi:hypothetical protein